MYRVVLVDDERLIVRGLETVVPWQTLNCEVVGCAYDGATGIQLIRDKHPDIVLTDIRMPNMDGLTMLAALKSEFPNMQTAVLTAFREFDYAQEAIRLGVCRYLLKPSNLEEIQETIQEMTRRLDAHFKGPNEPEAEASETNAGNFLVSTALGYMREHCMEAHLSLGEVADHVYVSQWHLSKLLNRETGQGFFDLLGHMRIDQAKDLLRDPALRVQNIAEQVGYSDVAHFSKSFKKFAGCTPGEYRKTLGRQFC